MIRAAMILATMAGPAMAKQDGWPALYDVSGVAATDVLNIRAAPDRSADIIGTLEPTARDVEVIRPNEAGTWGLVNSGERSGWVSLAHLSRHPGQTVGGILAFRQCFGTEPFWSLSHDGARITLKRPDRPPREGLISGGFRSFSRPDHSAFSGSFFPTESGEMSVTLMIRAEACNDGMSDRAYGLAVDMLLNGPRDPKDYGAYSGCCSLAAVR